MAPTSPSRPASKGGKAGKTKSRIKRISAKRGKYRPREAPAKPLTLGQRIRALRVAFGMTQKELGDRLRTDQTTVSSWEREGLGQIAGPSLVALAIVLGTTPDALLTGVGFAVPEEPPSSHHEGAGFSKRQSLILPPEPPDGSLTWIEQTMPDKPTVLEEKRALAELKRAIEDKRNIWVVVK